MENQTIQTFSFSDDDLEALAKKIADHLMPTTKNVLTMNDVCILTGLSKSYLYKLTCRQEIPHYKPNCKYIYFNRTEIEDWMQQNKVELKTDAE